MRISKLLVLGALVLTSSSAMAVSDNVRQKPAITSFADYKLNDTLYLYNVAAQKFFLGANDWNTRASVGDKGYKVILVQTDNGIELRDSVETQSTVKCTFAAGVDGIWVDNSNEANRFWTFTPNGDSYRISNNLLEPTLVLGWKGSADDTRLYLLDPATEGAGLDWKFVAPAVYTAYFSQIEVYNASEELKALLEEAEKIQAGVAAQTAVYENAASTVEELTKAIADAKEAIEAREKEIAQQGLTTATVQNPADVTSLFITNPNFDGNVLTGWSGSLWGAYNPKENAERYEVNFDTYQLLTDLPEGVYKFNCWGFNRYGGAQNAYDVYKAQKAVDYAKVYAAAGGDSLTTNVASPFAAGLTAALATGSWSSATDAETGEVYWIPNDMVAADEFFRAGYNNDNSVLMGVNDGTLRVGVRKDTHVGSDWSIFDTFTLTYYGNSAEAYQMWLDESLKKIADVAIEDGALFTESYLEAYNAAREGEKKGSNKEEVSAVLTAITSASDALAENLTLWAQLQTVIQNAKNTAARTDLSTLYTEPLGDWAEFDAEDIVAERALTNEELKALIEEKTAEIAEAQKHPDGEEVDMTNLLVNPDFSDGATGWTTEAASGGNVAIGGTATNTCYEAWNNAGFDIYQEVQNAPKGVYEISVQGFYRYGRGTAAWNYYQGQSVDEVKPGKAPVYIYLNDNQTAFTNVYGDPKQITDMTFYDGSTDFDSNEGSDGTLYYFPNGMASAAIAFSDGMYTQTAYGLVAQTGDVLRIGVKGVSNQLGDSWAIWDNFKLVWKGFDAKVVQPVLETNLEKSRADLDAPIGKDVAASLKEAIAAGEAAIAAGSGEQMFEALSHLFEIANSVNASKTLQASLETANERLANAMNASVCALDVLQSASDLNKRISAGLEEHSFADTEVEGLIAEINKAINQLGIPEGYEKATDAAPATLTTAIQNPNCSVDYGWEGSPAFNTTARDAEKYNTTYNVYQTLQGMPAGTYKVSLTGFYRCGTAQQDYDAYQTNPNEGNNAFLYAVGENADTVSVALKRLASDPTEYDGVTVPTDYVSVSSTYIQPNMMSTSAEVFAAGKFHGNEVIVKVGQDGLLTIGVKKSVAVSTDWTIWTDWQLEYYGTNSSLTPGGDASGIQNVAGQPLKVEYYNLSGARISTPQKGLVIVKQQQADGTVKTRKVVVK